MYKLVCYCHENVKAVGTPFGEAVTSYTRKLFEKSLPDVMRAIQNIAVCRKKRFRYERTRDKFYFSVRLEIKMQQKYHIKYKNTI